MAVSIGRCSGPYILLDQGDEVVRERTTIFGGLQFSSFQKVFGTAKCGVFAHRSSWHMDRCLSSGGQEYRLCIALPKQPGRCGTSKRSISRRYRIGERCDNSGWAVCTEGSRRNPSSFGRRTLLRTRRLQGDCPTLPLTSSPQHTHPQTRSETLQKFPPQCALSPFA